MYKSMRVCSDYLVGGSPSTLHDVNNQEWAPSVFETIAESTLQARSKWYETAIKRRKLSNELCFEVDKVVDEVVVEDDTEDDYKLQVTVRVLLFKLRMTVKVPYSPN